MEAGAGSPRFFLVHVGVCRRCADFADVGLRRDMAVDREPIVAPLLTDQTGMTCCPASRQAIQTEG